MVSGGRRGSGGKGQLWTSKEFKNLPKSPRKTTVNKTYESDFITSKKRKKPFEVPMDFDEEDPIMSSAPTRKKMKGKSTTPISITSPGTSMTLRSASPAGLTFISSSGKTQPAIPLFFAPDDSEDDNNVFENEATSSTNTSSTTNLEQQSKSTKAIRSSKPKESITDSNEKNKETSSSNSHPSTKANNKDHPSTSSTTNLEQQPKSPKALSSTSNMKGSPSMLSEDHYPLNNNNNRKGDHSKLRSHILESDDDDNDIGTISDQDDHHLPPIADDINEDEEDKEDEKEEEDEEDEEEEEDEEDEEEEEDEEDEEEEEDNKDDEDEENEEEENNDEEEVSSSNNDAIIRRPRNSLRFPELSVPVPTAKKRKNRWPLHTIIGFSFIFFYNFYHCIHDIANIISYYIGNNNPLESPKNSVTKKWAHYFLLLKDTWKYLIPYQSCYEKVIDNIKTFYANTVELREDWNTLSDSHKLAIKYWIPKLLKKRLSNFKKNQRKIGKLTMWDQPPDPTETDGRKKRKRNKLGMLVPKKTKNLERTYGVRAGQATGAKKNWKKSVTLLEIFRRLKNSSKYNEYWCFLVYHLLVCLRIFLVLDLVYKY